MSVNPTNIVDAARSLLGTNYRWWYTGASLPMWVDDGYGWQGYSDCPPVSHAKNVGVMCADLINFALQWNNLPAVGGTEAWANAIVGWEPFDVNKPKAPGMVAVKPYASDWAQGHIALYTGEHQLIQSINYPGVTEGYDDHETYAWRQCDFDWLGYIPGVEYLGGDGEQPTSAVLTPELLVKSMTSRSFAGPDLDLATARKYHPHLIKASKKYGITTRARLSAFLAQTGAESGSWQYMRELGQGSSGRFGNYYGRGPIQLTWQESYQAFQDATGYLAHDDPELVADDPEVAFMSAAWFWWDRGLNELADEATWDAYYEITGRIWGSEQPEPERDNRYSVAWDALPTGLTLEEEPVPTPPPTPPPTGDDPFGGAWGGFSADAEQWMRGSRGVEGGVAFPPGAWFKPTFDGSKWWLEIVPPAGSVSPTDSQPISDTIKFEGEGEIFKLQGQMKIEQKGKG